MHCTFTELLQQQTHDAKFRQHAEEECVVQRIAQAGFAGARIDMEERAIIDARYHMVINQIQSKCEMSARQGRSHALIYSFNEDEIDGDYRAAVSAKHVSCTSDTLLSGHVAQKVFFYCQSSQLMPTIETWLNPNNATHGWNIVVKW